MYCRGVVISVFYQATAEPTVVRAWTVAQIASVAGTYIIDTIPLPDRVNIKVPLKRQHLMDLHVMDILS
jgi:hypothetical protein